MATTHNSPGAPTFVTTDAVAAPEAFDFWRDVICSTFVQLAADPVDDRGFSGSVDHVAVGDVEMTSVVASGQDVRRTKLLIARSAEEFVLLSIQVAGRGRVEQGGRVAELEPGSMAFYDSTRPYRLHFDDAFEQLVVQVPRAGLVRASGLPEDLADVTARALPNTGTAAVVGSFFQALAKARHQDDAVATNLLQPQALSLFAAAAVSATGRPIAPANAAALNKERIHAFVWRQFANPELSVDMVASSCGMSRRTVFRALASEEDGFAGLVRRVRIEHAKNLLLSSPNRPISFVAGASGFASDATFYRAFREIAGITPHQFRESGLVDTVPPELGTL
jgi:AraC-like DNA-binding protein